MRAGLTFGAILAVGIGIVAVGSGNSAQVLIAGLWICLLAHLGLGYMTHRWLAVLLVPLVYVAAFLVSDLLYEVAGLNLAGYCGEPECDPGPIPASFFSPFVYVGAAVAGAAGIGLHQTRGKLVRRSR